MDRPVKAKRVESDRYLIAEQPGMKVMAIGIVVAFILGFTFKSLLSPQRITSRLQKAASHIHKDIKVTFGSAHLSLSNGILPRFAVVITQVRMESEQVCWFAPIVQIDELRLPLSLWGILVGRSPVQSIDADNMNLSLRSDGKDCAKVLTPQKEELLPTKKTPLVTLTPSQKADKYSNDVRDLSIARLNIVHEKFPQYATELFNFAVKVKSFDPRVIEVRAKTHLLKDAQVGDYLSHANLFIEYKESPEPAVQTHFFGNWREGHYSVIANYTIADHLLTMEGDLRHIPLSQVLNVLKKYNLAAPGLNSKQAWISAKTRLVGDAQKLKDAPLEVTDLKIEGDVGDLFVDRMAFSSLDPLKYSPINVDVRRLNIEKLLYLLNRTEKNKVLGHLGTFSGAAQIISDSNIILSGEHSGLEFIFSNRGQRELQVIESMQGKIRLQGDRWNFQVSQVIPRGGRAEGTVELSADRDFKSVNLKASIDDLSLADSVQRLMTNGGEIGAMSLNAKAEVKEGELSDLRGIFKLEKLNIEGMNFNKTRAQFDWQKNDLLINMQIADLSFAAGSPGAVLLASATQTDGDLQMDGVSARIKTQGFKTLEWRNAQGLIKRNTRLVTDGGWNSQGELQGRVLVKEGRHLHNFIISGSREEPIIESESSELKKVRK